MNIAILTHPLGANYGGILQAFALSSYLQKQGHHVCVLNRQPDFPFSKRLIKRVLMALHHPRYNDPRYQHLKAFVNGHINYTKPLWTSSQMLQCVKRNAIDAVFVGSDQVWRKSFAMTYGFNYFLDFVPSNMIRSSYAASFGLSEWEYNEEQTKQIKRLLAGFKTVSVREDVGVELCLKNIAVKAEHVLDPTMLLRPDDYKPIINPRLEKDNYVFVYWLGSNEAKQRAYKESGLEGKKVIDISPRSNNILESVEDWLSYIYYADRVITDSFHGCVFAMMFEKQFTICANNSGGNARLQSLFTMLDVNPALGSVDYAAVAEKLELCRNKSYEFINKTLQ